MPCALRNWFPGQVVIVWIERLSNWVWHWEWFPIESDIMLRGSVDTFCCIYMDSRGGVLYKCSGSITTNLVRVHEHLWESFLENIKQKFQELLSFSLNFIGNADDMCLYEGRMVCERDFRSGRCSPYQERYPLTWPNQPILAPASQYWPRPTNATRMDAGS